MPIFSRRPKTPKPTRPALADGPNPGTEAILDEPELVESERRSELAAESPDFFSGAVEVSHEQSDVDAEIEKLNSWREGLIAIAEIRNNLGDYSGAAASEMKVRAIIWALQQLTKSKHRIFQDFSGSEFSISMIEYDTYFRSGDIPRAIIALDYQLEALKNAEKHSSGLFTPGQRKYVELDRTNLIHEFKTESYRAHPAFVPTLDNFPAIVLYCSKEYVLETASTLLEAGENIYPLHRYSQWSRIELMKSVIAQGYDVMDVDGEGFMPIHWAARHGDPEAIKLLIESGVSVDQATKGGWSPLMLAAQSENIECVKTIIDRGAEISFRGENNLTPLHVAVFYKRTEIIDLLIFAGANESAMDDDGRTPSEIVQTGEDV